MWGRVVEFCTAVWLALSPYIFRDAGDTTLVAVDSLLALAICVLAGLSYWQPTRLAHFGNILIGLGLAGWARWAETPIPPSEQNHIFVGLFLLMMGIVPNNASLPPVTWRDY